MKSRRSSSAGSKTKPSVMWSGNRKRSGCESVTDGEFRRTFFHIDFLQRLQGVAVSGGIATKFRTRAGEIDFAPPRVTVTGKLRHVEDIQTADFNFLRSVATRTPKVTIPSPTMVHFRGGRRESTSRRTRIWMSSSRISRRRIATSSPRSTRPAAGTSSSTTRTSRTCAIRRCARSSRGARRRSQQLPHAYAALINSGDRRASAGSRRRHSPVPRQHAERVGGGRRLRAGRRRTLQRAARRRVLSRVRRHAIGIVRARCGSCRTTR